MANYHYEMKQNSGQVVSGVINAPNSSAAAQMIRAQGGYVLSLSEEVNKKVKGLSSLLEVNVQRGPNAKDVLNFTNQLAVMIKAGISIRAALDAISDQVENIKFKAILQKIKQNVEGGKSFSESLEYYPKVFNPLYINMVKASELSGNFGIMLERIVEYMEQQIETRSQVRGAMIYPIIISVMAVVTTVFMLTYVLPKFMVIFEGKEDILPTPTKIILAISSGFRNYWYLILAGLIGAFWSFLWVINTDWGRAWWDQFKLRIPIIKKMCNCMYITRSMHTMGELVNAGVPMLDTLRITGNISGNIIYKRMWFEVYNAVKEGSKITVPLNRNGLLPKSVIQMISSGEESGKLADVLKDVSGYYQKELKSVIRSVTAMIEPLMMVIMGAVVGFIAMSIILPIFKMTSIVK
ncbi:MAG: type II secretion system F family protein [Phycisphaerae bacterium]|nr:type II secretion system F family protein [Phycisphaerae bacterium]